VMRRTAVVVAAAVLGGLLLAPGAGAQTSTTVQRIGAARAFAAKARAVAAIDLRLHWLDTLTTQIGAASHLTAGDKSTLVGKVSADRTGLTGLRSQIEADDDGPTFRQHAQAIVTDYRVYLLLTPQVHITMVADALEEADAHLSIAADKLAAAGKEVTAVRSHVDAAKAKIDPVAAQVLALLPSGYPTNQSTLTEARDALRSAAVEIKAGAAAARSLVS